MTGNIPPIAYSVADYQKIQTELNQAREELKEATANSISRHSLCLELQKERDQLRAENAELRAKLATCEKLPQ